MTDDVRTKIVDLYNEGLSQEAIGKQLGYSQTKVSKVLHAKGIDTGCQIRTDNPNWKGGKTIHQGYAKIYIDALDEKDKQFARAMLPGDGQYILEHRLVMARYLERPLRQDETVHHINEDKTNNDLSNLQLRIGKHGKGGCYRCAKCHSIDLEPMALAEVV